MTTRRLIASVTLTAIVLSTIATVGLSRHGGDVIGALMIGGLLSVTALIGAVIVLRSDQRIGWLLLAISAFATAGSLTQTYAVAALIDGRALPGAQLAAWLALWVALPAVGLFVYLVLLFPTGRLPSRRWKPVAIATGVGTLGVILPTALLPGPMPAIPVEPNPLGIEGMRDVLTTLSNLASPIVPLCALGAVVSQVLRVRRSRGPERQQIKWVAFAMLLVPILIVISQMVIPQGASEGQWIEFALNILAATLIPIAIAVAMLRYRLYDIDVIINRTLVYVALTISVAAVYLGLVFVLQTLLPIRADSDVAVAASTLGAAALFRPLRTRLQYEIDRRFYRRRYDATKTLDGLAQRLRDEVDLSALSDDVLGVVGSTIQPVHASLWLREVRP